jgi:hypothetical protein
MQQSAPLCYSQRPRCDVNESEKGKGALLSTSVPRQIKLLITRSHPHSFLRPVCIPRLIRCLGGWDLRGCWDRS